ncbi:hypothetical protein C8Q80DRAFT_754904 [Daedaleopsis nitida]|nr:hypothetical protein C8Q80DRAFT_754904 [Daedaleopsis nitida]
MPHQGPSPGPDTWPNITSDALYELYHRISIDTVRSTPRETIIRIRKRFDIPNLTTRGGLKEAFGRLAEISTKLRYVFDAAMEYNRKHITRAIVTIWLSMCSDIVLCHRLLQAGIFGRLFAVILSDVDGRARALQLLSVIARYNIDKFATGSLEDIRPLIDILQDWRDSADSDTVEYTLMTLSHAFDVRFYHAIKVRSIPAMALQLLTHTSGAVMELLRRPSPPHDVVVHALPILCHRVRSCSSEEVTHSDQIPLLDFVGSLLRSEDISHRSACIKAFSEDRPQVRACHPHPPYFPAEQWTDRSRLSPDSLRMIEEFGPMRCESERYERAAVAFMEAFEGFLHGDQDLCALGRNLANIIIGGRYSDVLDKDKLPDFESDELSEFPYKTWTDCLLAAATALREAGDLGDLEVADTLDIEYVLWTEAPTWEKIAALCRTVLSRNPGHVYAHIKLSIYAADNEELIRFAKGSLELDGLSPHMLRTVLQALVDVTASQAMSILSSSSPSDRRAQSFAAELFKRTYHYTEVFLSESPPDCLDNIDVLVTQITTTLMLRGPELSDDFSEVQPALEKIKRTARLLVELGYHLQEAKVTAVCDMLIRHSCQGIKTWGDVIGRLNQRDAKRRAALRAPSLSLPAGISAEDEVANGRWKSEHCAVGLDGYLLNPVSCGCDSKPCPSSGLGPAAGLYKCSCCTRRTARLKRCGGCHDAWYCNEICQSKHWERHKPDCRWS